MHMLEYRTQQQWDRKPSLPFSKIAFFKNCLFQKLPFSKIAFFKNCLFQKTFFLSTMQRDNGRVSHTADHQRKNWLFTPIGGKR
jgi:hypothetical protein